MKFKFWLCWYNSIMSLVTLYLVAVNTPMRWLCYTRSGEKHVLIPMLTYCLGALEKNYCNGTLIVQVIVENVVTCFLWDTVYTLHAAMENIVSKYHFIPTSTTWEEALKNAGQRQTQAGRYRTATVGLGYWLFAIFTWGRVTSNASSPRVPSRMSWIFNTMFYNGVYFRHG